MCRIAALLLLLSAVCAAQMPAPLPESEVPQRKEILRNHRVTVSLLELAPHEATPMYQHDHDLVEVSVNGGQSQNTVFGHKAADEKLSAGETRFLSAGYSHSTKNAGAAPLRFVNIEFADPQGKMEKVGTTTHSCNPGSTACVEEKILFCTAKVCVENVTMEAGAVSTRHSHPTDHMLIADSDYQLTDEVEGKGKVVRTRKSGEVEFIPAGITHQMTNTTGAPVLFTVIIWR